MERICFRCESNSENQKILLPLTQPQLLNTAIQCMEILDLIYCVSSVFSDLSWLHTAYQMNEIFKYSLDPAKRSQIKAHRKLMRDTYGPCCSKWLLSRFSPKLEFKRINVTQRKESGDQ